MTIEPFNPPKVDGGYAPMFSKNNSANLPNNKHCVVTPRNDDNLPLSNWSDKGYQVMVNCGLQAANVNIPTNKAAFLFNKGIAFDVMNGLGVTNPANLTDAQITQMAQQIFAQRPGALYSSEVEEGSTLSKYDNPEIYAKYQKAMGAQATALGCRYFGEYAGGMYWNPSKQDSEQWRIGYSSNDAALQLCKTKDDPFSDYWSRNLYETVHLSINLYNQGATNSAAKYVGLLLALELGRKALIGAGYPDKWISMFYWPGNTEFTGYSQTYKRYLDAAKTESVTSVNWPGYCYPHALAAGMAAYDLGEGVWQWEDTQRYSSDPTRIFDDWLRAGDNFPLYTYSGPGRARVNSNGFFRKPDMAADAGPVAGRLYSDIIGQTGSQLSRWARHRAPNGNWTSLNETYVLDRYQNDETYVRQFGNGNICIVQTYDTSIPAGQYKATETQVDLGGSLGVATIPPIAGHLKQWWKITQ